jgi:uncharacterized protein
MSLKEQLLQDMKTALKEKDSIRKDIIQIIRAGILQIEKDDKLILDDSGIIDVISKEIKKRNDVLPDYEKSGRQESINEINKQLEILKNYLPTQLNDDEILLIINETIKEVGANSPKDMGNVMKSITPKIKGLADSKKVSELIKIILNK